MSSLSVFVLLFRYEISQVVAFILSSCIRLKSTDWGDLDVLILDLPPGTGDIQLGVLQELQLSGAVAVTTPSKLAVADTRKGIEMFTSLGVPTFAVVENMSYFEVSACVARGKFVSLMRSFGMSDLSACIVV